MPAASSPVISPPPGHGLPLAATNRAPQDNPEKIRKAAVDFEALMIEQILKSAREAGGAADDEEDETNSTVRELGEQQMAQLLARNGGLGIAKILIAGLNHANR